MTITITYSSGSPTTETYTGCSGYTNDGKVVKFTGTLSGETVSVSWEINFANVKKIRIETGGD